MSAMQAGTQMVKLRGGSKGLMRFYFLDEHRSCIRWRPSRKNEKAKSEWTTPAGQGHLESSPGVSGGSRPGARVQLALEFHGDLWVKRGQDLLPFGAQALLPAWQSPLGLRGDRAAPAPSHMPRAGLRGRRTFSLVGEIRPPISTERPGWAH